MKDKEVEVSQYYELCYQELGGQWWRKVHQYSTEEEARQAAEASRSVMIDRPWCVVCVEMTLVRDVVYRS